MRLRLMIVGFVFGGFSTAAIAGTPKLQRTAHKVSVRSWKGKGTYRKHQGMHIVVSDAQPDSQMVIERQQRSAVVDLPAEIASPANLEKLADGAARWEERTSFTTRNVSNQASHHKVISNPKLVMRPNSRFRVRGKMRDDQPLETTSYVVGGLKRVDEERWTPETDDFETINLAGVHLKSARAWMVHENVFVSVPETDPRKVTAGEAKLALAKKRRLTQEKEQYDFDGTKNQMTPAEQLEQLEALTALGKEITELESDGNALIEQGNRSQAYIASVAGTPIASKVRVFNPRLVHEKQTGPNTFADPTLPDGQNSFEVESSATSGSFHQGIDGVPHDKIELAIEFDATEEANGSTYKVSFKIPDGRGKPAFVMDGRKYYRIAVIQRSANHADPAP